MIKRFHTALWAALFLVTALAVLFLPATQALADGAAGQDTIRIDSDGTVTLVSARMAAEQVSSMQLTLTVPEGSTPGFTFSGGLSGRMTEQSATGVTLTIYIASAAPLMAPGQTELALGVITGVTDMEAVALPETGAMQIVYGSRMVDRTVVLAGETPEEPDGGGDGGSSGGGSGSDEQPADPRSKLQSAVDSVSETYGNPEFDKLYTPESWSVLLTAVDNANTLLADESAADEALEQALAQLEEAVSGLVRAGRAALVSAMGKAKAYDAAGYTADSYAALQQAIRAAEEVLMDDEADDAEWETARAQLEDAMNKLVPVTDPDGSGPVIGDGPDSGVGGGGTSATPVPTAEPVITPVPTATPEPVATPEPTATAAPAATAAPTPAPTAAPAAAAAAGGQPTPKTGDETAILPWLMVLCLSGALLAALIRRRGKCR